MRRVIFIAVFWVALFLGQAPLWAKTATSVVDATEVKLGESISLEVVADFSDAQVVMPKIEGFQVSSRGSGSSVQIINGTTTRKVSFRYLLVPLKVGRLIVPSLEVRSGKDSVHTHPITVSVLPEGTRKKGDDLWRIEAEVSNPSPYVGEAIVWTFRFYTAVTLKGGNLQRPSFEGFSAEEMGESRVFEVVENGRRYRVHEVRMLLVPQKAGELAIDPAVLNASLVVGKRRSRDPFFDDFFGNQAVLDEKLFSTKPVFVKAKPLPPYGGKTPFSGLVGSFEFSATLDQEKVFKGDPLTLTLAIKGWGNIKDAGAPALDLPKGLKHYGDAPKETISLGAKGWQGEKVFKTALVPLKPGRVELSPISLVWFDLVSGGYRTSKSRPLSFVVEKGEREESLEVFQGGDFSAVSSAKEGVKMKGLDILPLKVGKEVFENDAPLKVSAFLMWIFGPFALFLLFFVFLKRARRHVGMAEKLASKAREEIRRAEASFSDSAAFHKAAHSALTLAMGALEGKAMEGLTGPEVERIVLASTKDEAAALACKSLLESVEAARYGAVSQNLDENRARLNLLKGILKGVR